MCFLSLMVNLLVVIAVTLKRGDQSQNFNPQPSEAKQIQRTLAITLEANDIETFELNHLYLNNSFTPSKSKFQHHKTSLNARI